MADDDGRRFFFLLATDEKEETGPFIGRSPREAALEVARRLEPAESEELAEESPELIWLHERGHDGVPWFEGWAWTEPAGGDAPEGLDDTVTKADVTTVRVLEYADWRLAMMTDWELDRVGF